MENVLFPILLNDWDDYDIEVGLNQLKNDFEISDETLEGVDILLASYSYENYSGYAFVLFRKNGKLYEINGSHCSCYGLEGQWKPEEAMLKELEHRVEHGGFGSSSWGEHEFREELIQAINSLKNEGTY